MSAAAIDSNVLNGLFENQKKLDDLFDSIFDDGNYFISSESSSQTETSYAASSSRRSMAPKQSRVRDSLVAIKERCPYFFVLPVVLEIAAIYVVVANFW